MLKRHLKTGKIVVFDSLLLRNRKAFCIYYNDDEQIIYRGFFGLKCIPESMFIHFAKIKEVFDYLDRPINIYEERLLRINYKYNHLLKKHKKVCDLVKDLFAICNRTYKSEG